jgi:hypothetical protein
MHLEAAAATVTAQCDLRGAVQSSLLANELILKAAILFSGFKEAALKDTVGHDTSAMLDILRQHGLFIDFDRTANVLQRMPRFVKNRYSPVQPTRSETGHILMGVQFVASEIIRAISGRNVRAENPSDRPRAYP